MKKRDGTRLINGGTSTTTDNQFKADVTVQFYRKEGSRPHDLVTIMEYEKEEQYSGKGKFRAVYAGTFDGQSGKGTYYDSDGGSETFDLTR